MSATASGHASGHGSGGGSGPGGRSSSRAAGSSSHGGGSSRRARSASSRYDKPKKKKAVVGKSAGTSLVSIPNAIKLSMLNSGLLSLCEYAGCHGAVTRGTQITTILTKQCNSIRKRVVITYYCLNPGDIAFCPLRKGQERPEDRQNSLLYSAAVVNTSRTHHVTSVSPRCYCDPPTGPVWVDPPRRGG